MKIYLNKIIALKIAGLKCDADGCDYSDDTIHIQDYKMYLNAPCPKCGANLLTEKDMATVKFLLVLEKLLGWIRVPSLRPSKQYKLIMNGSGKVKKGERVEGEI